MAMQVMVLEEYARVFRQLPQHHSMGKHQTALACMSTGV